MITNMPAQISRRTIISVFFAALCSIALNAAAAIPPAEKLLPDDTLIVVGTPDFSVLREVYKTSPQTRLLNDPAMKPIKDKFISKFREEFVQPLERELGVKFDDFASLPQGQATFAITQNGWQGSADQPPAALFLLDVKEKSSQLKTNLADLRRKWVDAGKTIKTEKIRDLEFTSYMLSEKEVPQTLKKILAPGSGDSAGDSATNAPKSELVIGQFESLLIAGNSAKAVEKVVAHLTGGSAPALADVPAFEANRLALFRDAPLYGWVNAKAFLDLFYRKPAADKDSDTPNPLAIFSPDKLIAATGLGSMKTFAFAFQVSADGSLGQFFVNAPESSRQGLLKLLPGDGKESSPPTFVPADAVKYQRTRIDGQKAWATLQKIMNDLSPQIMNGVNFALDTANAAAKQKDPSFEIQKNLFGNLGDDLISYEKAPRGTTLAELNSAPSLFLLGSPRADQLADALKSIFVLMNPQGTPPTEREFLGRKIFSVPLPSLAFAAAGPGKSASRNLSYASSGSYVAITTDAAMLEEYLRSSESQQKMLRETPGLVEAAQKVGGSSVGVFGYQNNLEVSRALFETLRKTAGTNSNDSAPLPGMEFPVAAAGFKDWVDFSLLPPFEQISKYFYFSVYAVSANADGLKFKVFAPTPPQLQKQ
jgi:hypothetical protein